MPEKRNHCLDNWRVLLTIVEFEIFRSYGIGFELAKV